MSLQIDREYLVFFLYQNHPVRFQMFAKYFIQVDWGFKKDFSDVHTYSSHQKFLEADIRRLKSYENCLEFKKIDAKRRKTSLLAA